MLPLAKFIGDTPFDPDELNRESRCLRPGVFDRERESRERTASIMLPTDRYPVQLSIAGRQFALLKSPSAKRPQLESVQQRATKNQQLTHTFVSGFSSKLNGLISLHTLVPKLEGGEIAMANFRALVSGAAKTRPSALKRADDLNIDPRSALAVQHAGEHGDTLLGECVGRGAARAAPA